MSELNEQELAFLAKERVYLEDIKSIVGLTIRKVTFGDEGEDDNDLVFYTDNLTIYYECEADCCSSSWVDNIDDLDNMLNSEILEVEELKVESIEIEDYDVLRKYDYLVKTSKGDARIEFRNSSNGYYGGNLCLRKIMHGDEVVWQ